MIAKTMMLESLSDRLYSSLTTNVRCAEISQTPFSMIDGALGDAYTASSFYYLTEDDKWWDLFTSRVSLLAEVLRNQRFDQAGLLGGLSGMAYVLAMSRRSEGEFTQALSSLNTRITDLGTKQLWNLHSSVGKRREDYDYAVGLSGIAYYYLAAGHSHIPLAQKICDEFTELSRQPLPNSFWTDASDLDPAMITQTPELGSGMRDLGFAHGIAGVIAVLNMGYHYFGKSDYLTAATALMDVVVKDINEHDNLGPSYFQTPHPVNGHPYPSLQARQAWCYGTPSVELAAAGNSQLQQQLNMSLIHGDDYFDPHLGYFNESGLCHGVAGRQYVADQLRLPMANSWSDDLDQYIHEFLSETSDHKDVSFWHGLGGAAAVWAGKHSQRGYPPALTILGGKPWTNQ